MAIYGNGLFKTIAPYEIVPNFALANPGTLGTSLQVLFENLTHFSHVHFIF